MLSEGYAVIRTNAAKWIQSEGYRNTAIAETRFALFERAWQLGAIHVPAAPSLEALLFLVYRRVVDLVAFPVSSRRGESSGFAISRNNHVTCGSHLTSLFAHKLVGEVVDPLICPRVFNRNALYWIVFAIEFSAKFRMCRLTLSIDTISDPLEHIRTDSLPLSGSALWRKVGWVVL